MNKFDFILNVKVERSRRWLGSSRLGAALKMASRCHETFALKKAKTGTPNCAASRDRLCDFEISVGNLNL